MLENLVYSVIQRDESFIHKLHQQYPVILDYIVTRSDLSMKDISTVLSNYLYKDYFVLLIAFMTHMINIFDIDFSINIENIDNKCHYAQVFTPTYQSLSIFPIQLGTDLGIALTSYKFCRSRRRDYAKNLHEYRNSEYYNNEDIDNILAFTEVMESLGQNPLNWDINLYYRFINCNELSNKAIEKEIQLAKNELHHKIDQYLKFVD